mgnify:CR=1 FL=1
MNDQKRFLIIAPSWIGDLLMSQSVFKSLKNKYYNVVDIETGESIKMLSLIHI